ncbi:aldo/keto reductase [Spirosoma terrae]|uniref:Aldo/keto reductase n=1 Tax=Spirosoma terrae TaxID=1968276 RepID=A0A6L9KZD5_9BACT|nr:aldo/keto reductase [Spirosoma terrae]NDU93605.1 aldo/keto reductase [Spirosoma terrae]
MKKHSIGKSDVVVSEISFGCMSLTGEPEPHVSLLHKAFDGGITFFDTADLYEHGENEKLLGRAFSGMRQQVVIATKVGNQWRPDGSGWDWNPTKAYILTAVEESLKRLKTDYIDLYQLHGGTLEDPIDETIEAFELLKQQGKIREYGISSIRPGVIREWIRRSNIVSVMMQYSLLDRRPEESCLASLHQNQISVLARGSLAKGLLVNKPATAYLNYTADDVREAAKAVALVSDETRTETATAIQFALYPPVVASAVVGIRTDKQLADAIRSSKSQPLSQSEWEQLTTALSPNFYDQHR